MPSILDTAGNRNAAQRNKAKSSFFNSSFARFIFLAIVIPLLAFHIIQAPLSGQSLYHSNSYSSLSHFHGVSQL